MERVLTILLMFASGTLAGISLKPELVTIHEVEHPDTRAYFVGRLSEQFGDADTVLLGDSLVEYADFGFACGRTFNGGIGGARIQDLVRHGPRILRNTQPKSVVVAIGANHFAARNEIDVFKKQFPPLIDSLSAYDLVLVGVQNSSEADAFVRQEAKRIGAPYVAPINGPFLPDGLHHTPIGSQKYREAIVDGCNRIGQKTATQGQA